MALQYELADVTVTVNGRAAVLTRVTPTQINFTVPSDTTGGLADPGDVAGYITHGTAAVTGLNPTIFGHTGDASGAGAVLDAVGFQSGAFSATGDSLSLLDSRTRLIDHDVRYQHWSCEYQQRNDVLLGNGQTIENLAESVTVEARTSDGRVFTLPVEFAGAQGGLAGLTRSTSCCS